MYFDSHTHLNDDKLYPQRKTHLQNFFDAWGASLINVGVNDEWNQKAINMAIQWNTHHHHKNHIFASIWIHPTETVFGDIKSSHDIKNAIQQLETQYNKNPEYIVAIGECGNDAHHGDYTQVKDLQKELLYAQCILARKLDLPLIIHSRDNFEDAFAVLQDFTDLKIYFHCRWYGPNEITQCAKTFPQLRIGFCGNITYPNAHPLRESFQKLLEIQEKKCNQTKKNTTTVRVPPLFEERGLGDKLTSPYVFIETDAPYLSPQTKRGTVNTPLNVIDIYHYISKTFSIPLDTLQRQVQASFQVLIKYSKLY